MVITDAKQNGAPQGGAKAAKRANFHIETDMRTEEVICRATFKLKWNTTWIFIGTTITDKY